MSANDDLKRAIRARMAATGEPYTAALRKIDGEGFYPAGGWTWPDTVIPADLRPRAVDPDVVAIEAAPEESAAAADERRVDDLARTAMLRPAFDAGADPDLRSSKAATGLVRLRLEKMGPVSSRPEWRLRFPEGGRRPSDGHWNLLDEMIRDQYFQPAMEDYARAVAHVEEAMRRAAPHGFNGVMPYRRMVNRPFHRALLGLLYGLLAEERYDDALVVIENHLWLWPDRLIYGDVLWGLVGALQVPGLSPKHWPVEEYAPHMPWDRSDHDYAPVWSPTEEGVRLPIEEPDYARSLLAAGRHGAPPAVSATAERMIADYVPHTRSLNATLDHLARNLGVGIPSLLDALALLATVPGFTVSPGPHGSRRGEDALEHGRFDPEGMLSTGWVTVTLDWAEIGRFLATGTLTPFGD